MSEESLRLLNRLETAQSDEERAQAWHQYASGDELQEECAEAKEALRTGQPRDVIELASRNVAQRAATIIIHQSTH